MIQLESLTVRAAPANGAAFPGASIVSFDELPVREVPFETLDLVNITRDFLNGPENYLWRLTGAPQTEPSLTN